MLEFEVPIRLRAGKTERSKIYSLNLNVYRNLQFHVNNALKIKFREVCKKAISDKYKIIPEYERVQIEYRLFLPSKRKSDIGNWGAVVQKFTEDALVNIGIIEDDHYEIVYATCYRFGGIDPKNPRCLVSIYGEGGSLPLLNTPLIDLMTPF